MLILSLHSKPHKDRTRSRDSHDSHVHARTRTYTQLRTERPKRCTTGLRGNFDWGRKTESIKSTYSVRPPTPTMNSADLEAPCVAAQHQHLHQHGLVPRPKPTTRHFRVKLMWAGSNKDAGTFDFKSTTTNAQLLAARLQKTVQNLIPQFSNYWSVKVCCSNNGLELTPNPKLGLHYPLVHGQQARMWASALQDQALRILMSCQVKSAPRTGFKRKRKEDEKEKEDLQHKDCQNQPDTVLLLSCYSTRDLAIGTLLFSNDKQAIKAIVSSPAFVHTTDRELVLAAVKATHDAHCMLNNANTSIRCDERLAVAVIHQVNQNASHDTCRNLCRDLLRCSAVFRERKAVVLAAVEKFPEMLQYADKDLHKDLEIVLCAVASKGKLLKYACEELRNNQDVVLAAVDSCGEALKYASDFLRADRRVVLKAVASSGRALKYALQPCRGDLEVVLCAVSSYPRALKHADESLQGNRDVVLHALANVRCEHRASYKEVVLEYASKALRADPKIVLLAYSKNCVERAYALCDTGLPALCINCSAGVVTTL